MSTIYYLFVTLVYYLLNTSVFYLILGIRSSEEFLILLLQYTLIIWIFIFFTDFFPRIVDKKTLYQHLDSFFGSRRKSKFKPYFSNIVKTRSGSPIRYFAFAFLVSIFIGYITRNLINIVIFHEFLAFIYLGSIAYLANFPAYVYSRKFIAKSRIQDPI